MEDALFNVVKTLVELDYDACLDEVQKSLDADIPAWEIVDGGLSEGMKQVGDLFEAGEYFLGELIMAGNIMKEAMELLKDHFDADLQGQKGKVILATIKGDMHDLGKNIVALMLNASGYEIIDLGVDVEAKQIVKAVKKTKARGIGLTMLLTTGITAMKEVAAEITEAGLRDSVKIAIGGASTNQDLADKLGFDAYGENAVKAVRIFDELLAVS